MEQHWRSHGWTRSPTLRGVRRRADRKGGGGEGCGAEGPASGDARTEGLAGRERAQERGGLSGIPGPGRGRGLSGSEDDGLCLQRSRRRREKVGDAAGRDSNSRERTLLGEARGKKGF